MERKEAIRLRRAYNALVLRSGGKNKRKRSGAPNKNVQKKKKKRARYFMTQNNSPEQIVSCAVCAINNAHGKRVLKRSDPFTALRAELLDIQSELSDHHPLSKPAERAVRRRVDQLTNGTIRRKKKETLKTYVDRVVREQQNTHGPYSPYHVNLALKEKQLVKMRLFDAAKRLGIAQPESARVSTRTVDAKLREMRQQFSALDDHRLVLSTTSRKYPGHAHSVALRKVGGKWLMLDSEQPAPEDPPARIRWGDLSTLLPLGFAEAFPEPEDEVVDLV